MTAAIIYCGLERAWDKCSENHKANIEGDLFWLTEKIVYPYTYSEVHKYENRAPETHQSNAINMWHNRFVAFALMKPGYDVYCINRTDILFEKPVSFEDVREGVIYIPEFYDYREGTNDQFCYGDYNAVKHYVSLYLKYEQYYNEGVIFHPETMLKRHLRDVEVERVPIKHEIVRE